MKRPQVFPAIKGIWIKSKCTDIAYEVISIKFKQEKNHFKIREYKIHNQGFDEWWPASRFQLLTPFTITTDETIIVNTESDRMRRSVENNYFDDKIINLK